MQPRPHASRTAFVALVLMCLAGATVGTLAYAQDEPRRPSTARERGSGPFGRGRDVFDLIRSGSPAERLANLEGMSRIFEIHKAGRGDVQLTIADKGELEAAEQIQILCKVRARGTDKLSASTIAWLVEDGVQVKQGDVVARLDDAALRELRQVQQIVVSERAAQLEGAKRGLGRMTSEGQAQTKLAETDEKIAEAALKAHANAVELESRKAELRVRQARAALALAKLKGTDKAAALEIELAQAGVELAELEVKQLPSQAAVQRLLHEAQVLRAKDAVAQAQFKLEDGAAQARARLVAAEAAVALEKSKLADIEADLAKCTLTAPCDGLVLLPEAGRQAAVAVGDPVREGQRLLTINKTGAMQVRLKVPEGQVERLHRGQRAMITVAGIQQTLAGKIQNIAPVPSAADWRASNVRVYPVNVLITEPSAMLKPMMKAQVSITLDEQKNVLRVPIGAVSLRDGAAYCYVKRDDGLHERKVITGLSGTNHVEIKSGVEADEEVIVGIRSPPTGFPGGGGSFPRPSDR